MSAESHQPSGNAVHSTDGELKKGRGWNVEPQIGANARTVLERRYLKKGEDGKASETPRQLFERVAQSIATAEEKYGKSAKEMDETAARFYEMMARQEFMPNSPTLMNAGRELGQLSACFVLPVGDSMEEIFDSIKYTALIHKCLVPETLVMTDSGCMNLGSVRSDTWIETHEGMDQVIENHDNGIQEVITVETDEGYSITGTPQHRLMTEQSGRDLEWKQMGDLEEGETLIMKLGGWLGGTLHSVECDISDFSDSFDESVVRADERALCEFLRNAFTGHGWVTNEGIVRLALDSESVARELQVILFYVGVPTHRDGSRLTVCTVSGFQTFKEKIGFDSLLLSRRLAGLCPDDILQGLRGAEIAHEDADDRGSYRVKVKCVTTCDDRSVVDLTVKGSHAYLANGFVSHNSGGGTGFSFSRLRPARDCVKSTAGVSSGPISFMEVFNTATETIKQGGTRRGANMGILRVDHPDILEFITCKRDSSKLTNFNISVALTDKFMNALERDEEYDMVNPRSGEVVSKMKAKKVFDLIVNMAWRNGEPGIVFIDRINRDNPTPSIGEIESTNPCGEQPLLPYESCNLGSINLAKMMKMQDGRVVVDYDRLRETVHWAVRFLDDVIDVNKYPLEQIDHMTKANRKIGLGVMGFADMLLHMGIRYDSDEASRLGGELMAFIDDEGHRASQELADERGSFPNFEDSTLSKQYDRLRNATVTTIAPTGTISIITGASSGIEPIFAVAYVRNVMDRDILPEVNPIFEQMAKERGFYSEDMMKEIAAQGSVKDVNGVPEDLKDLFVTALDITPEAHVRMQAAFQEHTDNAVSKTVNFPKEATTEDVEHVYMLAHRLGCKGVTVYRYGSRDDQVLSVGDGAVKKESDEKAQEEDARAPRPRPYRTTGTTQRIETGCGHLYVTINEDENGLCEVFTQMGKSGGCTASQSEAIGRLLSLALRSGIDPESITKQLRGIRCPSPLWQPGGMVLSCSDAVAKALERYVNERSSRMGSTANSPPGLDSTVVEKQNHVDRGDVCPECPECGSMVEYVEGCVVCRICGYSRCW